MLICRRFGTRCAACLALVDRHELVRRVRQFVFHVDCFACCVCRQRLHTGDQLYIVDGCRFICKEDYLLQQQSAPIGSTSATQNNAFRKLMSSHLTLQAQSYQYPRPCARS